MQRFQSFIRANFLGIFLLGSGLASLSAGLAVHRLSDDGLLGSASSGLSRIAPIFLEDGWSVGQGNFGFHFFQPAPSAESLDLDRLISWRAHPEFWRSAGSTGFSRYILQKSRQYELPPLVVISLIDVESRYRPGAVSPRGAVGLLQLMPGTGEEMAAARGLEWNRDLLENPKANIELGLLYMSKLKRQFQKPEQWLTAYNIGPEALRRKLEAGEDLPREYVERVKNTVQLYRNKARRNQAKPGLWAGGKWL